MKRIAATLISCLTAFAQADEFSGWDEVYFDEMLRPVTERSLSEPGIYTYETADWWLINHHQSSSLVPKSYMLSVVEVAYTSHYNDIIYRFAEKYLNDNLAVFLQVRQSDQHSAQSHEYIGTGITLNNRWRAGDGIGLGISHARFSDHQTQVYPDWESAETAWELSYFGHLLNKLDARTSVYYIQYPTQHSDISDSIAAQLRVNFKF